MIIDQLTAIASPQGTDELPIERGQLTYKITWDDLAGDDISALQTDMQNVQIALDGKQDTLVSGTNIKTLNGQSLLGSGNLAAIPTGGAAGKALVKASATDYDVTWGDAGEIHRASITISYASWAGSGPYTQTVTISGATITANTKVDIQTNATALAQLLDDGVAALFVENNNGALTLYAVGAATTADITVQVTYYETV